MPAKPATPAAIFYALQDMTFCGMSKVATWSRALRETAPDRDASIRQLSTLQELCQEELGFDAYYHDEEGNYFV